MTSNAQAIMDLFSGANSDRLARQLAFLVEIDQAKGVLRRSYVMDGSRRENDGEHMWHVAVAASVLAEHSRHPVDTTKVVSMLLVHDIVEVDAGDTFVYDEHAGRDKAERERRGADRLFGLLPEDQGRWMRELWEEFEARTTPDARMAAAIDRLMPVLANWASGGRTWREHGISASRVRSVNAHVRDGSDTLQQVVDSLIDDAVGRGRLGG